MTIVQKAKQIADNGFIQAEVSKFVTKTGGRDVLDYIGLFTHCGIDEDRVWDAFEVWQEEAAIELPL